MMGVLARGARGAVAAQTGQGEMVRVQAESLPPPNLARQPGDPAWVEFELAATIDADQVVVRVGEVAHREARLAAGAAHAIHHPRRLERFERAVDRRRVQPGESSGGLTVDLGRRRVAT